MSTRAVQRTPRPFRPVIRRLPWLTLGGWGRTIAGAVVIVLLVCSFAPMLGAAFGDDVEFNNSNRGSSLLRDSSSPSAGFTSSGDPQEGGRFYNRWPAEAYNLDLYGDAKGALGIPKPSYIGPLILNTIANFLWGLSVSVMGLVLKLLRWAFTLDFISGGQGSVGGSGIDQIQGPTERLYNNSALQAIAVIGTMVSGIAFLWRAGIKRDIKTGATQLLMTFVLFMGAVLMVLAPGSILKPLNNTVKDSSGAVFAAASGAKSPNNYGQAITDAQDTIWYDTVHQPWVVLEFGGLNHCYSTITKDDLDPDATHQGGGVAGFGKSDKPNIPGGSRQNPDGKSQDDDFKHPIAISAPCSLVGKNWDAGRSGGFTQIIKPVKVQGPVKHLAPRRSNGQFSIDGWWLGLSDGQRENAAFALDNGFSGDDLKKFADAKSMTFPAELEGPKWMPATDAMGTSSQGSRLGLVFIISVVNIGWVLMLGLLSIGALAAQIILMGLIAIAPVAAIAAMWPMAGVQHQVRRYLILIAQMLFAKFFLALILGLLLLIVTQLGTILRLQGPDPLLGWTVSYIALALVPFIAFLYRKRLASNVMGAFRGQVAGQQVSRMGRRGYQEARRRARQSNLGDLGRRGRNDRTHAARTALASAGGAAAGTGAAGALVNRQRGRQGNGSRAETDTDANLPKLKAAMTPGERKQLGLRGKLAGAREDVGDRVAGTRHKAGEKIGSTSDAVHRLLPTERGDALRAERRVAVAAYRASRQSARESAYGAGASSNGSTSRTAASVGPAQMATRERAQSMKDEAITKAQQLPQVKAGTVLPGKPGPNPEGGAAAAAVLAAQRNRTAAAERNARHEVRGANTEAQRTSRAADAAARAASLAPKRPTGNHALEALRDRELEAKEVTSTATRAQAVSKDSRTAVERAAERARSARTDRIKRD